MALVSNFEYHFQVHVNSPYSSTVRAVEVACKRTIGFYKKNLKSPNIRFLKFYKKTLKIQI